MKKFLGTRLATILITALVCLVVFSSAAYAALLVQKDASTSVTVLAPQPGLEVYSDADCTIPLTSISYTDLYPGESDNATIYVKNTGQVAFGNTVVSANMLVEDGDQTYSTNSFTMNPGDVVQVDITVTIDADATAGAKNWTTSVKAYD